MTTLPPTPPSPQAETPRHILALLESPDGETTGPSLNLPVDITPEQLNVLVNRLLRVDAGDADDADDDERPYSFFIGESEITRSLVEVLKSDSISTEDTVRILYRPQALFRVQAVTRCSSALTGHSESILAVAFSPDGRYSASASGDHTVRLWDVQTETPRHACKGHSGWVLCLAFSPDGRYLASGSMDNTVCIWRVRTGELVHRLSGHRKWVTAISWRPYHLSAPSRQLVSSSRDNTARVWDCMTGRLEFAVAQHTDAVTCVKWSGEDLIYTGSRDKTVKVWSGKDGQLVRTLKGHAHWINSMALSTEYVLRSGPFNEYGVKLSSGSGDGNVAEDGEMDAAAEEQLRVMVEKKYREFVGAGGRPERVITSSDDFTMYLWNPSQTKDPISRLTGHQQLVNQAVFSPDGQYIASASFDKSVKLWSGLTGKFIGNLRGHVASVYQIAFSGDSRLLVSASKDSTLKLWDIKRMKLLANLPGHADEIYAVDWTLGKDSKCISGGKDRTIRFWRQ